jgi:hypothetical protein
MPSSPAMDPLKAGWGNGSTPGCLWYYSLAAALGRKTNVKGAERPRNDIISGEVVRSPSETCSDGPPAGLG